MDNFNLKKKSNRKKLFFKKNNILSKFGENLLCSKLNFIKTNPINIIQFGDSFNLNESNKKILIFNNFEEFLSNRTICDAFLSNFGLQIYLATENHILDLVYNSLKNNSLLCFNLITHNSFVSLKKMFYEIDENLFQGSYRRFGPFHDIQNTIEKLNNYNFKETVVSTEIFELNYNSLKKMRNDFKEFGISNYYNDKIKFKKDFYIKTNQVFEKIIKKNSYFPIELEIATFTTWKS